MTRKLLLFLLSFIFSTTCLSQNGVHLNSSSATNGYSLFSTSSSTYLVDNCGEIVNVWNVSQPQNHCKLLPNGNLMFMNSSNQIIEQDWNGAVSKSVTVNTQSIYLDYEVIKLKNENYLCVGREAMTLQEFKNYGYDIPGTSPSHVDIVVEIDHATGNIVWKWNLIDHVIQDKSSTKKSFGVIKDHPEKLNINAIATYDWEIGESFMINGMDYNEDLDQIVLSVRKLCEVVIIDHSTTSVEAAGSTGGRYGKGGDILYRFGNPKNYGRGSESDQQLYFEHNPNWIKYGPYKNNIMIFNNMLSTSMNSKVVIINPPIDSEGNYTIEDGKAYTPSVPLKTYGEDPFKETFRSGYTSGAKVLPNGNIVVTVGSNSTIKELDPSGNLVWEYQVLGGNYIFRTERYPSDFEAFNGKTLVANGTVETPRSTYPCQLYTSDHTPPKPTTQIEVFNENGLINIVGIEKGTYRIYNASGQIVQKGVIDDMHYTVPIHPNLSLLFLEITSGKNTFTKKILSY